MATPLLYPAEAARHIGVSYPTLYNYAKKRRLIPYVLVGTQMRFRERDLDQFLDGTTEGDTT